MRYSRKVGNTIPAEKCPPLAVLGQNLRRHREGRGISLRTLAGLANIHLNAIWRIEMGRVKPRTSTLTALAEALGTRINVLLIRHKGS